MGSFTFPPWPADITPHPLLVLDYRLLKCKDPLEVERLWEAATTLGFWYLKNHGAEDVVERMFDLAFKVMTLPEGELMKYEQGNEGESFGYKMRGADAVSATGELDTAEFLNIAKDDALAWPNLVRRKSPSYPLPVLEQMSNTVRPFILYSLEVSNTVISIFSEKLGMVHGELLDMHSVAEWSGSQARIIRNKATTSTTKIATGSHTDFGSLSFLHNRQGGLQVLPPGSDSWQYVKPLPRHAICNIGDALSILSGGVLRSNIHRVLPPPSTQANMERWSLVFFSRPGDSVLLRPLIDESSVVAQAVQKNLAMGVPLMEPGVTAQEWTRRRVKNRRVANREGLNTWAESRGTEGLDLA